MTEQRCVHKRKKKKRLQCYETRKEEKNRSNRYFRKGTLFHDSLFSDFASTRSLSLTRNNHINIGTPPHSCRDHPPFFLDNTIYSRGKRKGIEVSKPLLLFPFLSLFLFAKRTIQVPPLYFSILSSTAFVPY